MRSLLGNGAVDIFSAAMINDIIGLILKTGTKARTSVVVKEGISHTCVDLHSVLSVDETGVCIPIGNTEMFLAAVYKCQQRFRSDTDITELLGFGNKSVLAGDLNVEHPVLNTSIKSLVLEPLGIICYF
jgi:hypothetical protein